jgi:hypothetical protein
MLSIESAFHIDIAVVVVCSFLLLNFGRIAHSHPATIYLLFHLYTFTWRLASLASGSLTLWSGNRFVFEPVTHAEITRAAVLGDIALVAMTLAWLHVSAADYRKNGPLALAKTTGPATLSLRHIQAVTAVALPVGLVGMLFLSELPGDISGGLDFGAWAGSTWVTMTQTWFGLSLLALIYWYGFRRRLTLPLVFYLLVMAYQGYHRFRVLIPVLLLIQIYLDRRGRRWPTLPIFALLIIAGMLFYPLKTIGELAQAGVPLSEIVGVSTEIVQTALDGDAGDQQFLDQFASAITLVDRTGHFYYGGTYLPLLTLPIPRSWWPDKPALNQYMTYFSTEERPMKRMGMIVTLLGESYANFGYVGIVAIPFLLAHILGRSYFRAYRADYLSTTRFVYLLLAASLIHIYRGGLTAMVVYTAVNMMPLVFIVMLHFLNPSKSLESIDQSSFVKSRAYLRYRRY